MNLVGMGLLSSRGRGVAAFRQALQEGWRAPGTIEVNGRSVPAYQVDLEGPEEKAVLKKLRRADKLSKMAVLASIDAVRDSGLDDGETKRLGVIVATAFGAHVTNFEFLDDILDYGETSVSPTIFSNSVHNAAASYISSTLAIQGPTLTVTRFFFPFRLRCSLPKPGFRKAGWNRCWSAPSTSLATSWPLSWKQCRAWPRTARSDPFFRDRVRFRAKEPLFSY